MERMWWKKDDMQNFWSYLGMETGMTHVLKWTLSYMWWMAWTRLRWYSTGTRVGLNLQASWKMRNFLNSWVLIGSSRILFHGCSWLIERKLLANLTLLGSLQGARWSPAESGSSSSDEELVILHSDVFLSNWLTQLRAGNMKSHSKYQEI
jgi:hypothetical protein